MSHYLTGIKDYRVLLMQTEHLIGQKFAIKFSEDDFIFVSPAVYELAETELEKIAAKLMVHEVEGPSWRQTAEVGR
jgi:hypothetical protein